jgi:hypothetical protein
MTYTLLSLKWRNDKKISKQFQAIVLVSTTASSDQWSLRVGLLIIPVTNINLRNVFSCGTVTGVYV